MTEVFEFWVSGLFLGLVAGVSPGPLLTLVFSETLKHGKKEGIKVAVSPLITDLPIILLALFMVLNLVKYNFAIGIVSLLGACYLVWLGIGNVRIKTGDLESAPVRRDGLKRGVITNFLNPQPYLFWLTVGSSTIIRSLEVDVSATVLFVFGFYSMLIGSKIVVAFLVEKSKSFLKSKWYLYIIRALGIVLFLFALFFVRDGLELIGLF